MIFYASLSFFLLKGNYRDLDYFWDSIVMSLQLFVFMDPSTASAITHLGAVFANYIVILNWVFLILALLLILKPLVFNPIANELDRKKTRALVNQYGKNPISYLAYEKDKKYFFGTNVEGVVAYTVAADTAVCCGDIICNPDEASLFLAEFMIFCKQNGLSIVLLNVTELLLAVYEAAKFECAKYGEDAAFKLDEYSLAGGKAASVRAAVNHANRNGLIVSEYKPLEGRNEAIESAIKNISNCWLQAKACSELSFMFGGIGLEDPDGRRYFTASNPEGEMLGFVVFNPFDNGRGYLAEVTRRRPDAPQGVMEKIMFEAFTQMKQEGVDWGSLGLVPLVNVREKDRTLLTERLFEFIYENLNKIYGFKSLYHAKKKYAPTHWQPRYMVYYPPIFNAKIAYSIVKAQNPNGLSDYILALLKKPPEQEMKNT
jgi:phosphatidylglycerol lysyltransferase